MDFGLGAIGDPTENFILFVMSDNVVQEDSFTGDGSTKTFSLSKTPESIISVTVGTTETTAYTIDAEDKEITFTTAPANNAAVKVKYYVDL